MPDSARSLSAIAEVMAWLAILVAIHLLGARLPSDSFDLLVTAALAAAFLPFRRAGVVPRAIYRLLRRGAAALERALDLVVGLDFHVADAPTFPVYRVWQNALLALAAACALAVLVAWQLGSPLLLLLRFAYPLYLATAFVIWTTAFLCLAGIGWSLGRELDLTGTGTRRRRLLPWMGIVIAVTLAILVLIDSLVGSMGWLAGFAIALVVLAPKRLGPKLDFGLQIRVTRAGRGTQIMAMSAESAIRTYRALLILVALFIALLTQGHRLPFAGGDVAALAGRLPLLDGAGRAAAWALAALCVAWSAVYVYSMMIERRRRDPAFPGETIEDQRRVAELVQENVRLARLEPRPHGDGYLLAAHWWPAERLVRDHWPGTDAGEGSTGPRFDHHYGTDGRRALRQLLRPLAIDLVFIEDGVAPAQIGKTFDTLYRHLDRNGGRIEQHHLSALAAGHVLIEDVTPQFPDGPAPPTGKEAAGDDAGATLADGESATDDDPSRTGKRSRPKWNPNAAFDDPIPGRARVLLVMRPRGGDEDEVPDPFEFTREPGWIDALFSPSGPAVGVG